MPYKLLFTGNQHTLTDYLQSYFTTIWPDKTKHLTLSLSRTTAQSLSNAILTSDQTIALTTPHTTTPHIRRTSKTIACILRPYNNRVSHKPIFTLWRLLTNVKDKDEPEDIPGAVCKIKCCNCQATYICETGRNLTTKLNEHKQATKKGDLKNITTTHHLKTTHTIAWDSAMCVTYSTD